MAAPDVLNLQMLLKFPAHSFTVSIGHSLFAFSVPSRLYCCLSCPYSDVHPPFLAVVVVRPRATYMNNEILCPFEKVSLKLADDLARLFFGPRSSAENAQLRKTAAKVGLNGPCPKLSALFRPSKKRRHGRLGLLLLNRTDSLKVALAPQQGKCLFSKQS